MEALGINLFNIIVYSILFGIIFVILSKVFVPSMQKTLKERQLFIDEVQKRQKENVSLRHNLDSEKESLSHVVRKENQSHADQKIADAEKEAQEIITVAKKKAQTILEDAAIAEKQMREKQSATFNDTVRKVVIDVLKELDSKAVSEADPAKIAKILDSVVK